MALLAQMNWTQSMLCLALIGVCAFLMLIIMVQRGRGQGLTGAFGGGGGSSAFGAKTGDVFTLITVVVATLFLLLAVVANFAFDQSPKSPAAVEIVVPETVPGDELPLELVPVQETLPDAEDESGVSQESGGEDQPSP